MPFTGLGKGKLMLLFLYGLLSVATTTAFSVEDPQQQQTVVEPKNQQRVFVATPVSDWPKRLVVDWYVLIRRQDLRYARALASLLVRADSPKYIYISFSLYWPSRQHVGSAPHAHPHSIRSRRHGHALQPRHYRRPRRQ
jgi:hypothetical protein